LRVVAKLPTPALPPLLPPPLPPLLPPLCRRFWS